MPPKEKSVLGISTHIPSHHLQKPMIYPNMQDSTIRSLYNAQIAPAISNVPHTHALLAFNENSWNSLNTMSHKLFTGPISQIIESNRNFQWVAVLKGSERFLSSLRRARWLNRDFCVMLKKLYSQQLGSDIELLIHIIVWLEFFHRIVGMMISYPINSRNHPDQTRLTFLLTGWFL